MKSTIGNEGGPRVLEATGNEVLEIRDKTGRIRAQFDPVDDSALLLVPGTEVRFRVTDGKLEISCPAGLRFSTAGLIEFAASQGMRIATEDTSLTLTPGGIRVVSDNVGISAECVTVSGGTVKARLERLTITVGKLEQFASRVVQQARSVYQQIDMLLHTRAGRIRTETAESHLIQAESVRIVADEDVRIQANAINLG